MGEWTGGATGATGAAYSKQLEVEDRWRVVDQWWTDEPVDRLFMVVRAPTGDKMAVRWDSGTSTWSLREET
jgi:hypothetical protein